MYKKVYDCQQGCPVESTLQFISGKWKSVILYHLMEEKVCHFGNLKRQIPGCSNRMLALQLRELESDGIIKKTSHPGTPPKTDYELSNFGKTLIPVITAMDSWGIYYNKIASNALESKM